jgi:hypothetical protein
MSRRLLAVLACLSGCAAWGPSRVAQPQQVLHVSSTALPRGNGSEGRPFKTIRQAVAAAASGPAELRVHQGLYEEQVTLGEGWVLRGEGEVLLHADAPCAVKASGALLERVAIQGGRVGLCTEGQVRLRDVTFSGQREAALRVVSGGLEAERLRVEATVSELRGIRLEPGTSLRLKDGRFEGPFRRAIESDAAKVNLQAVAFQDAVTALQVLGGEAEVTSLWSGGGRGPAVHLGRGAVVALRDVEVEGHEYGLLAGEQVRLDASDVRTQRAERAGVAVDRAVVRLSDVFIQDAGNLGGLQLTESDATVSGLRVRGARFAGVQVVGGTARLERVDVEKVRREAEGDGDGVLLHRADVRLESLRVDGADGTALLVGSGTRAWVGTLEAVDVLGGALTVDAGAEVRVGVLSGTRVGGALVAALDRAVVQVDTLRAPDHTPPTWAECASGASVRISRYEGKWSGKSPACVRLGR